MTQLWLDRPALLAAATAWEQLSGVAGDARRSLRSVDDAACGPRVQPALERFTATWVSQTGELSSRADAHAVHLRRAGLLVLSSDQGTAQRLGELLDGPGAP